MAEGEPSTAVPEQEDSAVDFGPRKHGGISWLARCLFPGRSREPETSSCSSTAPEPLREAAAEAGSGALEQPHKVQKALKVSSALPRELLDDADEVPSIDATALLPPLPMISKRKPAESPERTEVDLPGKPSMDLWDALLEEAAQPRLRPTTFRRGRASAQMGDSSSSSRPTTAGDESAAASRQSVRSSPSWREEWTPGCQQEATVPRVRGTGSASSSAEGRPPKPPPMAGASSAAEDPSFTLALKRASQSVNARSATPPVDRRRWSKENDRHEEESSAADGGDDMPQDRADSKQQVDESGKKFSDLALSFASLDESM